MRKIREILRLKSQGRSHREIARSCKVGYGTVGELLRRASKVGLSWESAQVEDEDQLERLLYPPAPPRSEERAGPDFSQVYLESKRPGVTLQLLWEEYREEHPKGYSYSWFCEAFQEYTGKLDVTLRQHYKAGEQMQVDWAGQTLPIRDRASGEDRAASLFVACLCASQLTYAELCWGQTQEEWIGAHVRALEYFGGVPEIVVPDNTKTAITKACRYEPEENPTYAEMAQHYGMAVIPARVRRPRDKAKVENSVQQAERRILAKLRNVTFFSLAHGNQSVRGLLEELNDRKRSDLGMSRRELFEKIEKSALRPLPAERFYLYLQKKVRVGPDYHVEFERHFYSVPYQLVKQELNLKATGQIVELFLKSKSVARHRRMYQPGHSTISEHMPTAHREYLGWSPERLVSWSRKSGDHTGRLTEQILQSRSHPQQGYRSCLGLMSLGKKYGDDRLEAACAHALRIQNPTYKSVKSILQSGLDRRPLTEEGPSASSQLVHDNLRGAAYYAKGSQP
jgi:transposase